MKIVQNENGAKKVNGIMIYGVKKIEEQQKVMTLVKKELANLMVGVVQKITNTSLILIQKKKDLKILNILKVLNQRINFLVKFIFKS